MRLRLPILVAAMVATGSIVGAIPVASAHPGARLAVPGGPTQAERVAAAPGSPAKAPVPAKRKEGRHFLTLEAAVAAGVVDAAVVTQLRLEGEAEAILSLDAGDIMAAADVEARAGRERDRLMAKLEIMARGFAARRDAVMRQIGKNVEVTETWEYLDVARIRVSNARALLALARHGWVEGVTGIRSVGPSMGQSLPIIGQPAVKAAGYEGAGAYVAVLDTGVNYPAWPAFFPAGSVVYEADTIANDGVRDDNGHGTHVASTVLGVAPKTKILAYDVFYRTTVGCQTWEGPDCVRSNADYQIPAIQDVIARRGSGTNIVALNMSIGAGHYTSCNDYLGLESLRAVGILPVISAGNDYTVVVNGVSVAKAGISAPACIPAAVAVGASTDDASRSSPSWSGCSSSLGADQVATFSQTTTATNPTYGAQLDVLAPGQCIQAAGPGGWQGTSMAAPHVAGAIAVLRASWAFSANAAGALNVEAYLEYYGKPITDPRALAGSLTRPRLDLGAAVRALSGTADATPPVVGEVSVEMMAGTQLTTAGAVTTRIRWSATDASGIKQYTFWWRVDDGAWTQQALPSLLTSSWTYLLDPNRKWEFAVRAWDGRDNASEFKYSLPTRFTIFQENQFVTYAPLANWSSAARSDCLGGAMRVAAVNGSTAEFTFTNARQVAWIATMNVDRGWAYRWVDGRAIGWQNLYATTLRRRIIVTTVAISAYASEHKVKLWVDGTAGRPYVDIDAFILMQNS